MKKIIVLIVIIASIFTKFYYDGACIQRNYDWARFTPQGVYCYSTVNSVLRPYRLLREIQIPEKEPMRPAHEVIL